MGNFDDREWGVSRILVIIDDDVAGIAVNLCQRVQSQAEPGEVLATSTVRDLVAGSGLRFVDRGEHSLKGIPEPWRLYAARTPTS